MERRHAAVEAETTAKEDPRKHSFDTNISMYPDTFKDADAIIDYLKSGSKPTQAGCGTQIMQNITDWGRKGDEGREIPKELERWVENLHKCWDQEIEEHIPDNGYQTPTADMLEPITQQGNQIPILEEPGRVSSINNKAERENIGPDNGEQSEQATRGNSEAKKKPIAQHSRESELLVGISSLDNYQPS